MAYLAAVVIKERKIDGRRHVTIAVTETDARDTSEWSTVAGAANTVTVNGKALTVGEQYNLPLSGRILLLQATLEAGTGTTIRPRMGKASAWVDDTQDAIGGILPADAAEYINKATPLAYGYAPGLSPMYGRSTVNNATTDHDIGTIINIEEGLA
jgi:hypothetical protein